MSSGYYANNGITSNMFPGADIEKIKVTLTRLVKKGNSQYGYDIPAGIVDGDGDVSQYLWDIDEFSNDTFLVDLSKGQEGYFTTNISSTGRASNTNYY